MSNSYAPVETRNLKHSPNCTFFVNGDLKYPGARVCISNRIRTFEGVKDELTNALCGNGKRTGFVRNIYTPNTGTEVERIEDFQDGAQYVAAIKEKYFLQLPYKEIPERMRPPRQKGFKKIDIDRIYKIVTHAKESRLRNKSAQCLKLNEQNVGLRLQVSVNGFSEQPFHPVKIESRQKSDINKIKIIIQDTLQLQKIKKLFRVTNYGGRPECFNEIEAATDLSQNDHVLVMQERDGRLIADMYMPKGKKAISIPTSPRQMRYNNYEPFPPPRQPLNKYKKLPSIGSSSKQSDVQTMSPFSNPPGSQGGRKTKRSKNAHEVDYDKDEGGVYRSKKQNNARGAHQVNESRETRTEKPIDQMEAETVDEEEIHTKEKTTPIPPGTEINKQPSKETKQNADSTGQTKSKNEVKKGGKSSKEMNKVSVLPPIPDSEGNKGGTKVDKSDTVKKSDMEGIKDGLVKETAGKYEGGIDKEQGPFVDEKEPTPKDLKTDDVIEMSDRAISPVDLQSNEMEVNKPPMSTSPPQGKLTPAEGPVKERVDEDASPGGLGDNTLEGNEQDESQEVDGMNRIDEYEDDSFNRYDQNTSRPMSKDPRSSTPASRGEARRAREQKEHEAAAKIQAGVRGYKARKDYKQRKEAKRRQDEDRRDDDERRQQAELDRRRDEEAREDASKTQKKQMDEDEAATRIQASFKGHKARKEYKARTNQVRENAEFQKQNETKAATKIQSSYRGYKVRKEYNAKRKHQQLKETDINDNEKKDIPDEGNDREITEEKNVKETKMSEDDAAVAIQAGFKGYKTRKDYAQRKAKKNQEKVVEDKLDSKIDNNKTDINKKEHEAASQIQANYRGYKVRKEYAEKKKEKQKQKDEEDEHNAAVRIQASFRGYKTRKQESKPKEPQLPDQAPTPKRTDEDELNKAATKIQSGFRGYKTRKEYKSKVIDEHIVETDVAQLPDSAVSRSSLKKGQFIQDNKYNAASKIQSAFRVYHSKKVLDDGGDIFYKETKNSKVADEHIIAAFRGFRTRKTQKEYFEKRNNAAIKIQARYKGYKVRQTKFYSIREVNFLHAAVRGCITRKLNNVVGTHMKVTSVKNGDLYASKLQALCKAFITRHTVKQNKKHNSAKPNTVSPFQGPTADDLREEFQGEVSYWKDTNIKMYSDKTLRKAAARIQSAVYAYKTRKMIKEIKSKGNENRIDRQSMLSPNSGNALLRIQSCFKGHVERNQLKESGVKDLREDMKSARENDMQERVKEMEESVQEKDIHPHPPTSPRPASTRPVGAKCKTPSSKAKDIEAGKEIPDSLKVENSYISNENVTEQGKPPTIIDLKVDITKDDVNRSSTRLSGTAETVASESLMSISEIEKDQRRNSAKSYSTWKSSEKNKSSGGEVEREGESLREIEDDAGELSSIERNVNAVCQLQATFRAYKLRREISELMSGGGELMDMNKIDRAISALRKDFRLRSAKVRRLGSYQFDKEKAVGRNRNWWEEENGDSDNAAMLWREEVERIDDDETEESKNDYGMNENRMSEQSESIATIRCAMKGYGVRKSLKVSKRKESMKTIEAAYRGYRTRVTEVKIGSRQSSAVKHERVKSAGSRASAQSGRTVFHVQMHSDVINERCTRLQAAFAGCLTRKVFISLTKLVEQNEHSDHDTSGHQLERMGSLSETDDFKLRHKTIAKIQATYESYKVSNETRKGPSKVTAQSNSLSKFTVLPPIKQEVQLVHGLQNRPKSGISGNNARLLEPAGSKSKTQPDLYRTRISTKERSLNNIEIYVQKKMAATILQAHAKAYIVRKEKKKQNIDKKSQQIKRIKSGRSRSSLVSHKSLGSTRPQSEKVCFSPDSFKDSKGPQDSNKKKEDKTMTDMVRVRTASIKLEAERRKVIAEKMRIKQQADAENISAGEKSSSTPERMTPIPSSRLLTGRSHQVNDLVLREKQAAVKIQKVYRGHRARKEYQNRIECRKQLDKEYIEWKEKRRDATTTTHHIVNEVKEERIRSSDDETSNEDSSEKAVDDFSHLEADQGIIIINIGRSKSEIERANRKYINASMIQMTFKACKIRRKLALKGAKMRQEKNKAASKIQAVYKGYLTRHCLKESISATRIQSIFKAYLTRDTMQERLRVREEEQERAASLLQAAYMSFRKRRENDALKKERRLNKAAENVQCVSKGYITRLESKERRECRQINAASQIQASFKGQMERKKMRSWKDAVSVIVAGFKSYKVRQDVQELKDTLRKERIAATRLQAAYKAYLVRNSNRQYKEKMTKEKIAASMIQSSFRGQKARKQYRMQKELTEKRQQAAALKIQSVYRGHLGRKISRKQRHIAEIHRVAGDMIDLILNRTFNYVQRRTDSSERIQATVKGYNTRRQMTCKITDEAKQRTQSASVIQGAYRAITDRDRTVKAFRKNTTANIIQSAFRAVVTRERNDKTCLRNESATIIQSVFRAKVVRKKQDNTKMLEIMNESAVKIQSLYRGFRTRSEIQKEREMIADIEAPPTALISARTRSGKLLSISVDEVLMKNSRAIILFHRKATELQEVFKAYITRREMKHRLLRKSEVSKRTPRRVLSVSKKLTKEDKAAILIQKTFRGYWNRKVYQNAVAKRKRLRHNASTNLQAVIKGYLVRLGVKGRGMRFEREGLCEIWRKKKEAANIIAFAYRSHQHRVAKKALRVEM